MMFKKNMLLLQVLLPFHFFVFIFSKFVLQINKIVSMATYKQRKLLMEQCGAAMKKLQFPPNPETVLASCHSLRTRHRKHWTESASSARPCQSNSSRHQVMQVNSCRVSSNTHTQNKNQPSWKASDSRPISQSAGSANGFFQPAKSHNSIISYERGTNTGRR